MVLQFGRASVSFGALLVVVAVRICCPEQTDFILTGILRHMATLASGQHTSTCIAQDTHIGLVKLLSMPHLYLLHCVVLTHHLHSFSSAHHVSMHALQGYALTLGAYQVGLLGLAYMAVLVWAFTYPPIRGRWSSLDEGGVQVSAQRQGETP